MLLPAAVLIFLVLGALCVDYGSVYVSQRELSDAAAAAANDAATRALDLSSLYSGGDVHLVPGLAEEAARRSLAAKHLERLDAVIESVDVTDTTVTVRVSGRAHFLFAKAVPGGNEGMDISTTATAEAAESP
jgi:uncharacterized membrane protein